MAAKRSKCPKIYMYSKDHQRIKKFVSEHKDGETSGDLFGLWTDDNEIVIHLVTGQAGSDQNQAGKRSASSNTENDMRNMRKALKKTFGLPRIGKWQYTTDENKSRSVMAATLRGDNGLFKKGIDCRGVLLITGNYDRSEVQLSPFLVSITSVSSKGEIDTLEGESIFRQVDEIRKITGETVVSVSGREVNESEGEMRKGPTTTDESSYKKAITSKESVETDVGNSKLDSMWESYERIPRAQLGPVNPLKVYVFQEDLDMVSKLVLAYPDVETGGDLFGLWTSEGDAVIHIVLGPGKHCSRTNVSFNQDIPYLKKNGELLTQDYMLCHIGEWHSHHQLRLFQPSEGDSTTVIRNYPQSVLGFILIIANIVEHGRAVKLSPYLYTQKSRFTYDKAGEVISLPVRNAFKDITNVQNAMEEGKETELDVQRYWASRRQHYQTAGRKGRPRRGLSPARTYPPGHGNTVEPMEVDSPDHALRNRQSKVRR